MLKQVFALAGALFLGASVLSANVVVSAEFREVVTEAGLIVRGRVTDVRAVDVPGRGIESVVTVGVESTVKGDATPFVYLRVPGGEIGRTRAVMVGAPVFRVGERAVFFLKQGPDAVWRPIGLTMGVYRLQASASSGVAVVPSPILARVTAPASGRVTRGDPRRRMMPVAEFESLVHLVLQRRTAVPRGGGR